MRKSGITKRILAMLLTLIMVVSMVPVSVFAEDPEGPRMSGLVIYDKGNQTIDLAAPAYTFSKTEKTLAIQASFPEGCSARATYPGNPEGTDLVNGSWNYLSGLTYGTWDLTIVLSETESGASTTYTVAITNPEPVLEDDNTLYDDGIRVEHSADRVTVYQADAEGNAADSTEITNAHKYYTAVLPEGVTQFTAYAMPNGAAGKARYSVNGGQWQEWGSWTAPILDTVPSKIEIQIISEKAYAQDTPGWDGKPTNDFTLWVKAPAPKATLENVSFTIYNAGSFVADNGGALMYRRPVTVIDLNGDNKFSLDEALVAAHKQYNAESGYATLWSESYQSSSVTKLWGVETGAIGFYRNNAATNAVDQEYVSAGDQVTAFIYKDTAAWSDRYSFFDAASKAATAGEAVPFTLNNWGYDASYNPVQMPTANAVLGTYDMTTGAFTPMEGITTDEAGAAAIVFQQPGTYYVSARAGEGDAPLVPAICVVTVTEPAPTTATVNFTAQAYNGYLCAPRYGVEVSGDLAERYGYSDAIAPYRGVTALDVLVRAHEIVYGDDFTADTAADFLEVSQSGWASNVFGLGGAFSFAINGDYPHDPDLAYGEYGYTGYMINQAPVASGDTVEFFHYQDTDYYMDYYAWFQQDGSRVSAVTATAGTPITLNLQGYIYAYGGAYVGQDRVNNGMLDAIPDAQITLVNMSTGEITELDGAMTDEDGNVSLTFDAAGTYYISAYTDYEETYQYILLPLLRVSVEEMSYFPGSGTEEDPYRLENAAHLDNLDALVTDGETFAGQFFQITSDIALSEGWDGIGYSEVTYTTSTWAAEPVPSTKVIKPFAGHLDGLGHTLTFPSGSKPLFDCVRTATIQNLKIQGAYIADDGLIANYIQDGTYVTADISGITVLSGTKIAGSGLLGGYASGNNKVTITDCHIESGVTVGCDVSGNSLNALRIGGIAGDFNGTISDSTCGATVYGKDFVGGIVAGQGQSMSNTLITGCSFSGAVAASGNYVGGISGCGYTGTGFGFSNNAGCIDITNCTVTGSVSGGDYVGGILGAEPAVVQCWSNNTGEISGNTFTGSISSDGQYVGGVIGYMKSMNCNNIISGNTYKADQGIGGVTYVDTNFENPTPVEGTTYVNSETGNTGISGMSLTGQNRTDDPLGADAEKLAKKIVETKPVVMENFTTAYAVWGEQSFQSDVYTYELTVPQNRTFDKITATFDSEKYTVSYSYNGGKESGTLTSGSGTWLYEVPYGNTDLTVTVTETAGDAQAVYTFHMFRSRSTDQSLDTFYGGIYVSSHSNQLLQKADETGAPIADAANVSNDHPYYYVKLPDGSAQTFKLGTDANSNAAHKRYSTDGGTTWTDYNGYNTLEIQAPAKVLIQILSDAAYYEGTEGWTEKTPNQFTVWVDAKTEEGGPVIGFSGSGTEADPYLLENAAHLDNLDALVTDGETFEGKFFRITKDITLSEGWDGIGYSEVTYTTSPWAAEPIPSTKVIEPFAGNLDGQGHTLTFPSGSKPLFDCVRTATIQNLKIQGAYIADDGLIANYIQDGSNVTAAISGVTVLSGTKIAGSGLLGGYASGNNKVTITDCYIESGVTVGCDAAGNSLNASNIGGIAGDFNGTISGSTCGATVYGKDFVGGIVAGQGQSMSNTLITGCSFSGMVVASGKYVGGISGCGYTGTGFGFSNNASCIDITNCAVTGSVSGGDYVGGILGAEPAVVQCWSNGVGEISGNTFTGSISSDGQYLGGIIGYMMSMNRYNTISGNTYQASETLEKGIGGVTYVDTNCENPTAVEGTTYVNSAAGKTGIAGMTKTDHNRTDDPLGADAENLTRKLDAPKPVVSKLEISGSYKTEYLQGEKLNLSKASFTATWTDGTATHPALSDVTVQGYDAQKLGAQKVRLTYGTAYCEITVTVTAPVKRITVSFTMLGDTAHGDSGTKHTLVDGNLTTWIRKTSCSVEAGSTVLDVFQKVAAANGITYVNNGGYISSVTKGATTLAAFTNGANSGWMYTLNGTYPDYSVAEQQVKDGDVIVFHYTDDYNREYNGGSEEDTSDAAAEAVIAKIKAIGKVTYTDACKQKIDAARKAYDDLPYASKKNVTNLAVLETAEKAYADLKKADDQKKAEEVDRLIGRIDAVITLDSEQGIYNARTAYHKLSADQKALVKNYRKLQNAEAQLAELKADETDRKKAREVMDLIDGLGKITLQSKDAVQNARAAYDKLTQVQKALVTNYDKLEAAEKELDRLTRQSKYLDAYKATGDYLADQELGAGSEWAALGLLRAGRKLEEDVYQSLADYIAENLDENHRLHPSKSTDNSRMILALTAMGKDASNVEGQDLVAGLGSMDYLCKQGINGPIFALIALDSGNYPVPVGDVTRDSLVQTILDAQLSDGGFALTGEDADPDLTGMALQALAPYHGRKEVKSAIDRALSCLSKLQLSDGGFATGDSATSESAAQVIVALTALGIDPDTDARFVKNGSSVLDAILAYYVQGGGFKHILSGERNGLATQQSYYALAAYARFLDGQTSLYNMTDVLDLGGDAEAPAPTETQVTQPVETIPAVTEPVPVETVHSSFPGWIILVVIVAAAGAAAVIVLARKKIHK